jgi:hypothetical protein
MPTGNGRRHYSEVIKPAQIQQVEWHNDSRAKHVPEQWPYKKSVTAFSVQHTKLVL